MLRILGSQKTLFEQILASYAEITRNCIKRIDMDPCLIEKSALKNDALPSYDCPDGIVQENTYTFSL